MVFLKKGQFIIVKILEQIDRTYGFGHFFCVL